MLAKRQPDGRVVPRTPAERVAEIRAPVTEARMRVHELSRTQAEKPEAGFAIGRALIQGLLSRDQAEAAHIYERVQADHREAILARQPLSGGNLDRAGGYDGSDGTEPSYVHSCEYAERRMRESRRALLEADPLAQLAVDAWVLENKQAWGLLVELRVGLNALVRVYGIETWRKAS